ncbi:hypothetical protein EPI10_032871 [Gossypium australe]|uniref:Uncharacterized protein n=1 Tax=Gossypium australe TaxID=47621 RepID=A0A5B6X7G6_9ROSI|nr:hypothetical protein EPI10_032871 [Gossypium australe]
MAFDGEETDRFRWCQRSVRRVERWWRVAAAALRLGLAGFNCNWNKDQRRCRSGRLRSASRPFGISSLIAGHDENGPSL